MVVTVGLLVVGWFGGWLLFWRLPRLHRVPQLAEQADASAVLDCTVVVPARDEEQSLPVLLESLTGQAPRPAEVIVVDDGSTDRTRAVAQSFPGVTVVDGEPVPEGWTGKSWACWQGARLARGRLLVFVDADVCFGSSALGLVVTRAASQGGLFSVVPYHRVQRRYEQLSAPFSLVSVMGVGAAAVGRPRVHGAFGPCLACSIEDYFEVGGHRSVRDRVIDDVALAERFSARGLPVEVVGGGDAISYRMYPSGLAQLVEGWSKNMAAGAGSLPWGRQLVVASWVAASLSSLQLGLQAALAGSPSQALVASVAWGAFAVQQRVMLRQLGSFRRWVAVLHPFMTVFFAGVFLRSLWLTVVRGHVRWRGRTIPVRSASPSPVDG
ncbi:MAG: glycosyltransferase [Acidimicrobiales bacterium]